MESFDKAYTQQKPALIKKKGQFIYINLHETSKKESINNCDVLLSMIEIASNKSLYKNTLSNTTKAFWEKTVQNGIPIIIFRNYKPETLRKYWIIIKSISVKKFVNVVYDNRNLIDSLVNIKLKPLIIKICEYVDLKDDYKDSFENYIKKIKETK